MTEIVIEIYIEVGKTRSVACSWEWPGWCRYGKTAESAQQALLDAAPRYQRIALQAGFDFALPTQVVSTQLQGNSNTDWAPTLITERDLEPRADTDRARDVVLLRTAWATLDEGAATSSPTLRKGPRGGGREVAQIVQHCIEAELAYARKIGIKHPTIASTDSAALAAFRDAIAATLLAASDGTPIIPGGWPEAYAVRRMAWHIIDHIWEIEDRQM